MKNTRGCYKCRLCIQKTMIKRFKRIFFWCVAVVDNEVVGVAGVNIGKYADRIKGFFVEEEMRNKGIGTALLQDAMKYTKAGRVTAYCTRNSEGIFTRYGFKVTREPNRYGISFTEWRRES